MGAPSVPPGFAAAAVGLAAAAMALPLHRPRARRALLLTVVPALALVAAILPLLFGGTATAFRAALVLAATAAVAVLAALLFPRLSTFALLLSGAALLGAGSVEPRPLWIALLGLSIVLAALLARSERFGLRVALSLWGAAFLARAHPALDGPLREAAIALVLLAGALLVERLGPRPPPPGGREPAPRPPHRTAVVAGALGAGMVTALLVLALPSLLPALPSDSTFPVPPRLARLAAAVPEGGILWPLPSEAVTWTGADSREHPWLDLLDARWLTGAEIRTPRFVGSTSSRGSSARFSLHTEVVRLRAVKDASELAEMKRAAEATVLAVVGALPLVREGTREADLARAVDEGCRKHGMEGLAFPPVASSGPAAATIHGGGNLGVLRSGTLLVLDVGCRTASGYASDFTRTLPVGGRFTARQREVVDAVFAAQSEAAARCRPGVLLSGTSVAKGADSLEVGARDVLRGRLGEERMPHGLGHGVGLFVHDPLPNGPLAAGMVVTLEPGTYLRGELGSRIEDTFEVTPTGCVALTAGLPGDPASIEKAMAAGAATPAP